ncbi:MAG TPA: hypothetical protein VNX87_17405 [Candidatus Sulfotelmatobacter sp.]|jgi:hypothetical protein|nr:hypothetical protein [Candidatus Sulfotelmatobacter sp.]
MPVSFERDIRPLFRQIDIDHMNKHDVLLDNYTYMSDPSTITATLKVSRTV